LTYQVGRHRIRCDFNLLRRLQVALGQAFNFRRQGCAKEERLPILREGTHDAPNARLEAHVQHSVGFVENDHANSIEVHRALVQVIFQTTWCGHDDVWPSAKAINLLVHRRSANEGCKTNALGTTNLVKGFCNLKSQFSRRCEDEALSELGGFAWCLRQKTIEHRQAEGKGLTRAGLSNADDVHSSVDQRDGSGLDWSRLREINFGENFEVAFANSEGFKTGYGIGGPG
jgi:hypothetical protein